MGLLQTLMTDGAGPGGTDVPRWKQLFQNAGEDPRGTLRLLNPRRWSERTVIALVMQHLDNSITRLAQPVLARAAGPPGVLAPGPAGPGGGRPAAPSGQSDPDEGLGLDRQGPQAFGWPSGTLTLVYPSGVTYSPPSQTYRIPADARAKSLARTGNGRYFTDMTVSKTHIRVMVTGIGPKGALMVALPMTDVDRTLHNQLLLLIGIGAGGIALAAFLGILVARTALAPIARFTRRTETIAAAPERLDRRVEVTGRDELSRLGRSFNATLDALERSVPAQRNLVADASGGVPADPKAVGDSLNGNVGAGFLLDALIGNEVTYPKQWPFTPMPNSDGVAAVTTIKQQCVSDALTTFAFKDMNNYLLPGHTLAGFEAQPGVMQVTAANQLADQPAPRVPVYQYHSAADEIVPLAQASALHQKWCTEGVRTRMDLYPGDHVSGDSEGAPAAVTWLDDVFTGQPILTACLA